VAGLHVERVGWAKWAVPVGQEPADRAPSPQFLNQIWYFILYLENRAKLEKTFYTEIAQNFISYKTLNTHKT
jgi:hypothetical protein